MMIRRYIVIFVFNPNELLCLIETATPGVDGRYQYSMHENLEG